jgi:hypothetical protein
MKGKGLETVAPALVYIPPANPPQRLKYRQRNTYEYVVASAKAP